MKPAMQDDKITNGLRLDIQKAEPNDMHMLLQEARRFGLVHLWCEKALLMIEQYAERERHCSI